MSGSDEEMNAGSSRMTGNVPEHLRTFGSPVTNIFNPLQPVQPRPANPLPNPPTRTPPPTADQLVAQMIAGMQTLTTSLTNLQQQVNALQNPQPAVQPAPLPQPAAQPAVPANPARVPIMTAAQFTTLIQTLQVGGQAQPQFVPGVNPLTGVNFEEFPPPAGRKDIKSAPKPE